MKILPGQTQSTMKYKSALHKFDILTMATSKSTINEECRAIRNADDDYFDDCELEKWRIWYSVRGGRNTPETHSGGAIYRMVDEWGNEAPYDFKNLMFKMRQVSDESEGGTGYIFEGMYFGFDGGSMNGLGIPSGSPSEWAYTFSVANEDGGYDDGSLTSGLFTDNVITGEHDDSDNIKLHRNVFYNKARNCRIEGASDCNIVMNAESLTIGGGSKWICLLNASHSTIMNCSNIGLQTIKDSTISGAELSIAYEVNNCEMDGRCFFDGCQFIYDSVFRGCIGVKAGYVFGSRLTSLGNTPMLSLSVHVGGAGNTSVLHLTAGGTGVVKIGANCGTLDLGNITPDLAVTGADCNILIGDECDNIKMGDGCSGISIGNKCVGLTFGAGCETITIGQQSSYNSFGAGCKGLTIGGHCNYNSFGAACDTVSIGGYCSYNSFGSACHDLSIGAWSKKNVFGAHVTGEMMNYCCVNRIGSGVKLQVGDGFFGNVVGDVPEYGSHMANNENECYIMSCAAFLSKNTKIEAGNGVMYNTISNCGANIQFGDYCYFNKIGQMWGTEESYYETEEVLPLVFGDSCYFNEVGDGWDDITFGSHEIGNKIGTFCRSITIPDYWSFCKIGDHCQFIGQLWRRDDPDHNYNAAPSLPNVTHVEFDSGITRVRLVNQRTSFPQTNLIIDKILFKSYSTDNWSPARENYINDN